MGLGTSITTAVSEKTAVVIEDYMFDASVVGELTPEASPSDFHDAWDLDGTDFMPEASPDDEGYWDDFENVVTNGTFDADANWTKSNTTISGGVAVFATSGSAKYIRQDSVVETGNSYVIKLTVVRTSGTLQILFGTGGNSVSGVSEITASGTYTFTTTPLTSTQASSGRFWAGYTSSGDNFIGTVDNVSVTEYAIQPLDV